MSDILIQGIVVKFPRFDWESEQEYEFRVRQASDCPSNPVYHSYKTWYQRYGMKYQSVESDTYTQTSIVSSIMSDIRFNTALLAYISRFTGITKDDAKFNILQYGSDKNILQWKSQSYVPIDITGIVANVPYNGGEKRKDLSAWDTICNDTYDIVVVDSLLHVTNDKLGYANFLKTRCNPGGLLIVRDYEADDHVSLMYIRALDIISSAFSHTMLPEGTYPTFMLDVNRIFESVGLQLVEIMPRLDISSPYTLVYRYLPYDIPLYIRQIRDINRYASTFFPVRYDGHNFGNEIKENVNYSLSLLSEKRDMALLTGKQQVQISNWISNRVKEIYIQIHGYFKHYSILITGSSMGLNAIGFLADNFSFGKIRTMIVLPVDPSDYLMITANIGLYLGIVPTVQQFGSQFQLKGNKYEVFQNRPNIGKITDMARGKVVFIPDVRSIGSPETYIQSLLHRGAIAVIIVVPSGYGGKLTSPIYTDIADRRYLVYKTTVKKEDITADVIRYVLMQKIRDLCTKKVSLDVYYRWVHDSIKEGKVVDLIIPYSENPITCVKEEISSGIPLTKYDDVSLWYRINKDKVIPNRGKLVSQEIYAPTKITWRSLIPKIQEISSLIDMQTIDVLPLNAISKSVLDEFQKVNSATFSAHLNGIKIVMNSAMTKWVTDNQISIKIPVDIMKSMRGNHSDLEIVTMYLRYSSVGINIAKPHIKLF